MVGAPAAASAALTVASVGRTDALSTFSSRGPRAGDYAVKPDIAENARRGTGTFRETWALRWHPEFEVDRYYERLAATYCRSGFLRRVDD